MSNRRTRRYSGLVVALAALTALAGCGSSGNAKSEGDGGQAPVASDAAMVTKGTTAGKAAGKTVKLPKLKIGFLRYTAQSPGDQRVYQAAVDAAKVLGWQVVACDSQGDPVKMASCANTLLNDKIDAYIDDGMPESTVADGLRRAKAAGIPTIYVGAGVDPHPLHSAGYAPPESDMGALLSKYFIDKMKGKGSVVVQTFPAAFGTERVNAFKSAIKGTDIKIVAEPEADATDLVAGTTKQVSALLNQYPDTKGLWVTFETAAAGAAQALVAKYPGKQFPERPLLGTFYANQPTLDLIRSGQIDAASEEALEWSSWVAIDQLAEHVARKTAFSQDERPNYGPGLDFWRPTLVTKENLPPKGQLVPPPVDYRSFFQAKWAAEFGVKVP